MKYIKNLILLLLVLVLTVSTNGQTKKPNILFIVVDDLKPVLGCYGDQNVKTPSIDNLAKKGVVFDNAYCQQAVCAPSRISCFTGMRPDRTKVVDLKTDMRDKNPDIFTLPQFFKLHGYETAGLGKLMHGAKHNDPRSWTIPYKEKDELNYAKGYDYPANGKYQNPKAIAAYNEAKKQKLNWKETNNYLKERNLSPAVESQDVPDDAYPDGAVATNGIKIIEKLSKADKPFFVALGFNRPHLPFAAPKKYWDMYKRADVAIAPFQEEAKNAPEFAYHTWGELRSYSDIPAKGALPEDKQKELIHGYWASTSFADAQIGKVMAKLKELKIDDNTIVVLWGDHGWHLGDHGLWCKHSNFEQATKVPFIISAPGLSKDKRSATMTEMVDIFPTLVEYAGIEVPSNLEGESLIPVLENPKTEVKDYALSQFPRGNNVMGYSMRTKQYRLTLWLKGDFKSGNIAKKPVIEAMELYDYKNDPLEKESLATNPKYAELTEQLKNKLLVLLNAQAERFNTPEAKSLNTSEKGKANTEPTQLLNEQFNTPFAKNWSPIARNGAEINFSIDDETAVGAKALKADVVSLGAKPWDAQIVAKNKLSFTQGEKVNYSFKYKGGGLKVILTSDNKKHIVRKFASSNGTEAQNIKIEIEEGGSYTLKFLFEEKGVYLLDNIKVITGSTTKAKLYKPAQGFKNVGLDSPLIQVLGANCIIAMPDKLYGSRFSEQTLAYPKIEAGFAAEKAKTTSGIKIRFKTSSSKVLMVFKQQNGLNRGSEFAVLQNGKLWKTFKFMGEQGKKDMTLEIVNAHSEQETLFEVVLPSLSNVALMQLMISENAKLLALPKQNKQTYIALGNSITHGVGQGSASYLTYPYILAEKLNANYYNLAVGGAKISQPIAEMTKELPQADIITILIGYNDMVGNSKPVEKYISDYKNYLTEIRKNQPNAKIYCISITHTKFVKNEKTGHTPDDFRKALKDLTNEFITNGDKNLFFVDGKSITSEANLRAENLKDKVHFGIKGAELFANELYSIISKNK